ncbi:MAG: sulfurtransferase-like selenium metabolism protein YedF [Firmicutes bacterium]|nr:sulfurtransferase-like selenium metabolism protein YedF [Bacillota bacterium]
MKKTIDARGLGCPLPVIETKKALNTMTAGVIEVIVDNPIAVQNLEKMAVQKNLVFASQSLDSNKYVVQIKLGDSSKDVSVPQVHQDKAIKNTVVVLSSNRMGQGDDQLGEVLMNGYVYALTELDDLPSTILLYNSGVWLSTEGSEVLEDLRLLESKGVEVLSCGTCLDYYKLTDKLGVGSVTNMYTIAEIMMEAEQILKP